MRLGIRHARRLTLYLILVYRAGTLRSRKIGANPVTRQVLRLPQKIS